ncbi:MAG TPA: MBL fold metallo-hydrolase [Clostridium sp.]|nr:MBL fold metallo-hydrolase [Clostridium sp.]
MNFKIIGSGGCVALPKPLCCCRVCMEARKKGNPYARFGCSLYLEEAKLLVDTPEDIAQSLNYGEIKEIDRVLYSHMDPDHTLGMRVFEQLRLNWLNISQGIECDSPIEVIAMKHVMEELNSICSKHGSYFDYYEKIRNLIKRHVVNDSIQIGEIKITLIKAESATVFVFEEEEKKLIYAPCDVKPFPVNGIFKDADVMIIGNTVIGDVLKGDFKLEEDNPLREELFVMDEIVELKNKYNIKKVIMTHLEEDWGKSYDDYLELEKQYEDISFAYDGMVIEL